MAALAHMVRQHVERQRELAAGAFELEPDIDWAEYVRARLARANARIFVAEADSRLIGYVDARIAGAHTAPKQSPRRYLRKLLGRSSAGASARILRPRSIGVIEEVYVEPEERRRGVAVALASRAIDWLEAAGAREIEVNVWSANQASRALASKLGFRPARLVLRRPSSPEE